MPRVSVNIPCFNSAKFIKETIESVLAQTYTDFELIVMDDGSTDGTGGVVSSFGDPRIRYFYKDNEGLSETRNRAILESKGEYIAFLDHDDIWLPEKLKEQVEFFDSRKDHALIFSDSYVSVSGVRQKITYFERCRPKRGFIFEDLLLSDSNFIPLPTVMMRRDIFEKIGYFKKEFRIGEEYELFLRAADAYKFDYIEKPLAEYRMHDNNTSLRKDIFIKEAFEILSIWKKAKPEFYEKKSLEFRKKEARLLAEAANFYALNLEKAEAIKNFSLSLKRYDDGMVRFKKNLLSLAGCRVYGAIKRISDRILYGS